jgi:short-subunit dehydrogenase
MTDLSAAENARPLAIVTGASSGIGYELANCFADDGYDLLIAADDSGIVEAAQAFRAKGGNVETVQVDLATEAGVQQLYDAAQGRPIDALAANAGEGLGHGFLDQDWDAARHVIDTNVTGTLKLLHLVGRDMRARGRGRILITGSIAGLIPGAFMAVYNGSKAFLDSFSFALRNELKDTEVSVTCLMPGATDTDFFERAGLMDTKIGQSEHKMDPAKVARIGYDAMVKGEGDVVAGVGNKLQAAAAAVTPQSMLAESHRKMAEPGTGKEPA